MPPFAGPADFKRLVEFEQTAKMKPTI